MARLADLPLKYRLFMKAYPFRRVAPTPWTPLARPLSECRVALVTSAAFYLPDQEPFDESVRGGDASYRVIPLSDSLDELDGVQMGHRSAAWDPSGVVADWNVALPARRFRELAADGVIGELHSEAFSFMGSVTAPARLRKKSAPEAAQKLAASGVDVAFLVPV